MPYALDEDRRVYMREYRKKYYVRKAEERVWEDIRQADMLYRDAKELVESMPESVKVFISDYLRGDLVKHGRRSKVMFSAINLLDDRPVAAPLLSDELANGIDPS